MFLICSIALVFVFFLAVALLVVFCMDSEGKQALKLNAQVETQIILEDIESITRFSVRVRYYRIKLASKQVLTPAFN